jgi:hypothetical protein
MRALLDSQLVRSLSSIRLGLGLGFAASALLALSSLTIPDPRGGKGLPFSESFEPFLASFELRYAWFWPLAALLGLLALNVLLSTLRSALLRPRASWDLRFAGVVLMHVGVVGGLGTHLAAGLSAEVEQSALLTATPRSLAGRSLSLADLAIQTNPDGSLRTASATVMLDGERRRLAYNEPLFFDGMRRFVLIQDVRQVAGSRAAFTVSGEQHTVDAGGSFGTRQSRWLLGRTGAHPSLGAPMALVRPADSPDAWRWIAPGQSLAPGVVFEGVLPERALAVVVRRNDGIPILLGASALFSLGLVLFVLGRAMRNWRGSGGDSPRTSSRVA